MNEVLRRKLYISLAQAGAMYAVIENPPPVTGKFREAAEAYKRGDAIKAFNESYKKGL